MLPILSGWEGWRQQSVKCLSATALVIFNNPVSQNLFILTGSLFEIDTRLILTLFEVWIISCWVIQEKEVIRLNDLKSPSRRL